MLVSGSESSISIKVSNFDPCLDSGVQAWENGTNLGTLFSGPGLEPGVNEPRQMLMTANCVHSYFCTICSLCVCSQFFL